MVTVTVPATSANLGPGFDCLGLALRCHATLWAEACRGDYTIAGCPTAYASQDNLALRAYRLAQAHFGLPGGVRMRLSSDIPVARGLGSSAALTVAGLAAACALHMDDLPRGELLTLAARMEGHPDNVAPALLGGLQAAVTAGDGVHAVAYAVHPCWRFAVLIPPFELPTSRARAALPDPVPRADAVYGVSRTALLLGALRDGDAGLLRVALDDRLHQPYRFPLIAGGAEVRALALRAGADGCCISGAGPALLAVGRDEGFIGRLCAALAGEHPAWRALPIQVDARGARVERDAQPGQKHEICRIDKNSCK